MNKITLSLLFLSIFSISAQDNCLNAVVVDAGTHAVGIINGDTAPLNCTINTNGANAEWYKYTTTDEDIQVTVSTEGSGLDTRLNVYSGTCDNLVCVGGDDDNGSGNTSVFSFAAAVGTDYYILFDNRWSSNSFDFTITEDETGGEGNGVSFTSQSVSTTGSQYIFADMNGDDLDDLATVDSNTIMINYQKDDQTFDVVSVTTPNADNPASWSAATGDLDGNGYMDFLYGNGFGVTFMYANKSETSNASNNYASDYTELSPDIYVFSQRTNFVDINNDGLLDAFVCHDVAPNVYFINDGNGGLETHQVGDGNSLDLGIEGSNYATIFFDYDNDHDIDMYITKCTSEPNRLIRNNGDGTYTDVSTGSGVKSLLRGWSSAAGDFNNDGYMDLLLGASDGSNGLMVNNGDGTFSDVTTGSGFDNFGITSHEYIAEDFNNDGYVDVLSSGRVMINNGDMTFTESAIVGEGSIGDGNNDGFLDVFTSGGTLKVNNNTVGNWLKVNLTGVQSNLDGIGSRIEITTALGTQIRDVRSGVGFKHMSSLTAHFGIGEDTVIENLKVYWTSGEVDIINNPTINESLNITEGSAPLSVGENLLSNVSIYPNPVVNELTINSSIDLENSVVAIFDIQGKKVYNSYFNSNTINVSALESGVYFLRIIQNNKKVNLKFIKK